MKILLEPKVRVIGKPQFIEHEEYKIPSDGTDSEKIGAFAAKGCYDSYGEMGRSNILNQQAVIESEHGSVLEHAHVSIFIEGITRALSLELNRHRPFNISQRSTRYTKEEESAIVLDPYYAELYRKYEKNMMADRRIPGNIVISVDDEDPQQIAEADLLIKFIGSCRESIKIYGEQVDKLIALNPNNISGFDLRKWARGKARNVLPHALETRGVWTNNFRGYRWFIELRSERHAEPEIRVLANKMLEALRDLAPTYFSDFEGTMFDGIMEWKPKHSKI
jgi:thymidylate synthase (FAD)